MLPSRSARVSDSSAADVPGRGAFIVFEGLDRSGKSTQCSRAAKLLEQQGLPVQSMRFPDRSTPIGQEINAYLASTKDIDTRTIHQLFSQNRWEKKESMEKLLLSGTSLLVDRYAFSGVAYSTAKGLDMDWCKIADAGLPAPDLVIYLDVNPEAASKRGDYGLERYEKLEFQMLVAKHYAHLRDSSWKVVDASEPLDDVTKKVELLVKEAVERCRNSKSSPVGALWSSFQKQTSSAVEQSLGS